MVRSCLATTAYQQVSAPLLSAVAGCLLHGLGQEMLASTSHPARQGTGLQPSPGMEESPSSGQHEDVHIWKAKHTGCREARPRPAFAAPQLPPLEAPLQLLGCGTLCSEPAAQPPAGLLAVSSDIKQTPSLISLREAFFFTCNRKTLLKAGKTVMCFPALFLTLWCDGYHYGNDSSPPSPY